MSQNLELSSIHTIEHDFTLDDFDFSEPYFNKIYLKLQQKGPMTKIKDSGWIATGYNAIESILKDHTQFLALSPINQVMNSMIQRQPWLLKKILKNQISKGMEKNEFNLMTNDWLLFINPPRHTKIRNLMNFAFMPGPIRDMRPVVERETAKLLDNIEKIQKEFDFIKEFAFPLPIIIITEIMGIEEDKKWLFKEWTKDVLNGFNFSGLRDLNKYRKANKARAHLTKYLETVIEEKKKNPSNDLISILITKDYGDITNKEIINNLILLLFAGHETTVNLLTNGIYALTSHPEQYIELRVDNTNLDNFIEETLRYDPSLTHLSRIAKEDIDFMGYPIKKGEMINISIFAGNRDSEIFKHPNEFNIKRSNSKKHLSFGKGIHYCLGAPLARLEAEIGFKQILERFEPFQLAKNQTLKRNEFMGFSGFKQLLIRK